jgi:antitoxin ParD1/3/4
LISHWVDGGHYQNASEVLGEGLRLLEQREAEVATRLDTLRHAIEIGCLDFDEGRFEALGTGAEIAFYLDEIEANETSSSVSRRIAISR